MVVDTKESILNLIQRNHQRIRACGVERLGLFGSFLHGTQHAESDIDLLVEFACGKKSFDNFINLNFFLEELFGRRVELITPESLSPYIGPHIISEVEYVPIRT